MSLLHSFTYVHIYEYIKSCIPFPFQIVMIFHNIFYQINAVLISIRDYFQQHLDW